MPRRSAARRTAPAVVALMVLAGCGGGAPASGPETPPASDPSTAASPLAGTTAPAAEQPGPQYVDVLRLDFDGGTDEGPYVVQQSPGGALATAPSPTGTAMAFPDPCDGTADESCPRALVEVPDMPGLDPGPDDFRWGATLLLEPSETSKGSNVVQKGFSTGGAGQWKLQVDGLAGRAQCVLVGSGSEEVHVVRGTSSVADGAWHEVTCTRSGDALVLAVDGEEQARGPVPADLQIENAAAVRIGAKSLKPNNDQFFGLLDEVVVQSVVG